MTLPDTSAYKNFHSRDDCSPFPCAWHAPSTHHMVEWSLNIRWDRGGFVERICPHGVGHPDPDHMAFIGRRRPDAYAGEGVHGCDGCCRSAS